MAIFLSFPRRNFRPNVYSAETAFTDDIIQTAGIKVNKIKRLIPGKRAILELPRKKEEWIMNCNANKSIECTVKQCAHHCDEANYCSLDRIMVGTHEANPTMNQCTDCMSFKKK